MTTEPRHFDLLVAFSFTVRAGRCSGCCSFPCPGALDGKFICSTSPCSGEAGCSSMSTWGTAETGLPRQRNAMGDTDPVLGPEL